MSTQDAVFRIDLSNNDLGEETSQLFLPSLTVDILDDENDGILDPGDVSLREAIAFTQAGGVVNFAPGLEGEIVLDPDLGQLMVNQEVTIDGPGAEKITISGDNQVRVFFLASDTEINGLTITNGSADSGAGIYVDAAVSLTLLDSNVSNNIATLDSGGLYNDEGFVDIIGSTFSNNTAERGGGLFNEVGDAGGTLVIDVARESGD